jgi:hypothetical protein
MGSKRLSKKEKWLFKGFEKSLTPENVKRWEAEDNEIAKEFLKQSSFWNLMGFLGLLLGFFVLKEKREVLTNFWFCLTLTGNILGVAIGAVDISVGKPSGLKKVYISFFFLVLVSVLSFVFKHFFGIW